MLGNTHSFSGNYYILMINYLKYLFLVDHQELGRKKLEDLV